MANIKLILVLLAVIFLSSQISCKEAILHISNGSLSSGKEYCLDYDPARSDKLSETLEDAVDYRLLDLTWTALCDAPSGLRPEAVKGAALVVMLGRCEVSQKARTAHDLGASALLVASNGMFSPPPSANQTTQGKPRLPVVSMWYGDILEARRLFGGGADGMRARLYDPPRPRLDPSIAVILLIAVTTVALGGYWSGVAERARLAKVGEASGTGRGRGDEEDGFDTPLKVLSLVAMLCVMLLLMYYFYDVLVYVVMGVFCVGSASALFGCVDAALQRLGCGRPRLPVCRVSVCVRSALLAAGCAGVVVVWLVHRKAAWIWTLQNVLGMAFCCFSMKSIPLSSFRICSLLFGLLLAYDVFFVFVTPVFTADGVSVMEQVALGSAAATERLPVVMMVPRLLAGTPCGTHFSILGYGDMVVPGLLVAYCSRFDQRVGSPGKVYFLCCCGAYLLGMLATFAAMLLSGKGQPALLYLVPSTLTGAALVAWSRGEMRHFWTGSTAGKEEELATAP